MLQLRSVEARLIDRSPVVNTTGRGVLFHAIPCALWRVVLGGRHLWQGTDSGARGKPERMGYWDWDPCGAPSSSIFHDFHSDLRSQSIIYGHDLRIMRLLYALEPALETRIICWRNCWVDDDSGQKR